MSNLILELIQLIFQTLNGDVLVLQSLEFRLKSETGKKFHFSARIVASGKRVIFLFGKRGWGQSIRLQVATVRALALTLYSSKSNRNFSFSI